MLSFHCDTVAQTLAGFLAALPTTGPVTAKTIKAACEAATGHTFPASTSVPGAPGLNSTSYLAGFFG